MSKFCEFFFYFFFLISFEKFDCCLIIQIVRPNCKTRKFIQLLIHKGVPTMQKPSIFSHHLNVHFSSSDAYVLCSFLILFTNTIYAPIMLQRTFSILCFIICPACFYIHFIRSIFVVLHRL